MRLLIFFIVSHFFFIMEGMYYASSDAQKSLSLKFLKQNGISSSDAILSFIQGLQPQEPLVATEKIIEIARKLIADEIQASKTYDFYLYQQISTKNALIYLAATLLLKEEKQDYVDKWDTWRFNLNEEEKRFLSVDNAIILKERSHLVYTLRNLKPYLFNNYFSNTLKLDENQFKNRNFIYQKDMSDIIIGCLNIKKNCIKKAKKDILKLSKKYPCDTLELIRLKTDIYNQDYDTSWYHDYLGFFKHAEGVKKHCFPERYSRALFTNIIIEKNIGHQLLKFKSEKIFYNCLTVDDSPDIQQPLASKNILSVDSINLEMVGNAYTNQHVEIVDVHNTVSEIFPKFYSELKQKLSVYEKEDEIYEERISGIGGMGKYLLF